MLAAIVLLAESFATTVAFWTFPFSVKDVLFNAIDLILAIVVVLLTSPQLEHFTTIEPSLDVEAGVVIVL